MAIEIRAALCSEHLILAVPELAHLPPQFRNRRRGMLRCPIATGNQIERHA